MQPTRCMCSGAHVCCPSAHACVRTAGYSVHACMHAGSMRGGHTCRTFSSSCASSRQGPHQVAKKSTTMGFSLFASAASSSSALTMRMLAAVACCVSKQQQPARETTAPDQSGCRQRHHRASPEAPHGSRSGCRRTCTRTSACRWLLRKAWRASTGADGRSDTRAAWCCWLAAGRRRCAEDSMAAAVAVVGCCFGAAECGLSLLIVIWQIGLGGRPARIWSHAVKLQRRRRSACALEHATRPSACSTGWTAQPQRSELVAD